MFRRDIFKVCNDIGLVYIKKTGDYIDYGIKLTDAVKQELNSAFDVILRIDISTGNITIWEDFTVDNGIPKCIRPGVPFVNHNITECKNKLSEIMKSYKKYDLYLKEQIIKTDFE